MVYAIPAVDLGIVILFNSLTKKLVNSVLFITKPFYQSWFTIIVPVHNVLVNTV